MTAAISFAIAILVVAAIGYLMFKRRKQGVQPAQTVSHETSLSQGIADAVQMIAYASRSGISLDPEQVQAVIVAQSAGAQITPAEESMFWAAGSVISRLLRRSQ